VVEGASLESWYTLIGIKGSNPFLSAKNYNKALFKQCVMKGFIFCPLTGSPIIESSAVSRAVLSGLGVTD
jgi:hypothetical protein